MNINRDNYEMYFLMYADNELSAAARNAVELFVEGNPDLKDELEQLRLTTLPQEEIIFVPKTLLYKNATGVESVQQSLLLHLDNELSPPEAEALETQIAANALVKTEWDILQHTRLDAKDTVLFEDKASLYRSERDKVVPMRWWKIAAAAALIAGGLFTGISLYNNGQRSETHGNGIIVAKNDKIGKTPEKTSKNNIAVPPTVADEPKENLAATMPSANRKLEHKHSNGVAPDNKTIVPDHAVAQKDNGPEKDRKTLVQPGEKNIRIQSNETEPLYVEHKRNEVNKETTGIASVAPPSKIKEMLRPVTDTEISGGRTSFATLAVNNEPESDDRILYMSEEKITRSKVAGLFRKVKRVVERNTRIKTSDGLRIGGFEFAVK
jgi:hypothetical protein